MTQIIFATDLHGNKAHYHKLYELAKKRNIRNIVIGGDICPNERVEVNHDIRLQREFLEDFALPLAKNNQAIQTFLQMGNDDFRINMDILEDADKRGILCLTHMRASDIGGYKILGYSFVNELPFRLKDWEKMDDHSSEPLTSPVHDIRGSKPVSGTILQDMDRIREMSDPKNTIYSMHAPPFNTGLDLSFKGHVGSRSIRRFIEKEQPYLTLHGHIHESPQLSNQYKEKINKTVSINPGSTNDKLHAVIVSLEDLQAEPIRW